MTHCLMQSSAIKVVSNLQKMLLVMSLCDLCDSVIGCSCIHFDIFAKISIQLLI